jgi:hypothetical protein
MSSRVATAESAEDSHAEVADQALLLESGERLERLRDRAGLGSLGVAEPEVDHVEHLKAEMHMDGVLANRATYDTRTT